ncbi:four helix bundle protein [Luteolibacter marinus]|uniref:four helix bundle protein n=1 Tax=Luteolibacter marinus TaxID=2776705 RepID=UPI0018684C62|nr:four helix bundle protein [Luteolibacter marinus]
MIVRQFEDLEVYQLALALQRDIFALTRRFPKEEIYSLTDQIRRSSRSVAANIAEGWHKRRYPAHFASKLTDSDGEAAETRHWVQTGLDSGYLSEEEFRDLIDRYLIVGAKLGSMIQNAEKWKPRE